MEIPHIDPSIITLPIFGGIQMLETLRNAIFVTIGLIVLAMLVRIFVIPKFNDKKPSRFQMILELSVDGIKTYTTSQVGEWASTTLTPYVFTIALFVITNGIIELFGIRAATTDINCTLALALISFTLIQVYSLKKKGIMGRLKHYTKPIFLFPIKIITDIAVPVSLSCRMFGNLLGGMVIMELLYSVAVLRWVLPGVLAIYFTIFHTLMQTFIFITLSLTFINEACE